MRNSAGLQIFGPQRQAIGEEKEMAAMHLYYNKTD